MSFYFRDKPKFGDRLRGKSGDELLQEIKQQFDEDSKSFFEPTGRSGRDPFERHSSFPRGFPFDDEGFGRRSDFRAHLDDLAARYPELADRLPAWGDIPFPSSFRNRNRSSGNSANNNYQGYSDEDARSQASGSSAASGVSAGSSYGEPESNYNHQDRGSQNFEQGSRRSQIPQYGLRNTVDIGQHHHNMENLDKGNRGQRSMSAPPENRQSSHQQQSQQEDQQSQQQPQGQRYVSRIDITPQHNQPPQQQQQQPQQPQQQQQSQQKPQQQQQQQQSNVRHIPIFVEGRDEPVLPRSFDEPHFRREPSPTQFHAPPHFQRSSPFGQSPFGRSQWSPHFQNSFYPPSSSFEQSPRRQQQAHAFQHPRQPQFTEKHPQQQYAERQPPQQHYEQPKHQQRQQQSQHQQQQQQQQQPQQEPPKPPKPTLPKDPLERVALVQKEVDALAEQVKQYNGNSRKDKQYIYLDEMLTRELIKLDDIETEGRENVRQARKNTIRSIQETISLLESKALPSQTMSPEEPVKQEDEAPSDIQAAGPEPMNVDQKTEQAQIQEPIPLPPGPSSPTKKLEEANTVASEGTKDSSNDQATSEQQKPCQASGEPMDTASAEKTEATPIEVQQNLEDTNAGEEKKAENVIEEKVEVSEGKKQENVAEERKPENVPEKTEAEKKPKDASKKKNKEDAPQEKKAENVSEEGKKDQLEAKQSLQEQQQQEKPAEEKMEVENEVKKSPKTPKKTKKSKKQTPVSDKPIPLPAPEGTESSAK